MEAQVAPTAAVKRSAVTPKAFVHQKYGSKACYKIEEVQESVGNSCPGLVIPQQARILYRCCLSLPDFSVTSDTFTRKKDAEQSAAKIAMEKLGIQSTSSNLTPEDAWNELVARFSLLFSDEFLLSSHPLAGHFRLALRRVGNLFGMVPSSAIAACDVKVNNLCKTINPKAEIDPLLVSSLILKAARMSSSVCTSDRELWIWKQGSYSSEVLQSLMNCTVGSTDCKQIEAVRIPCLIEDHVEILTLDVSDNQYYMDEIAHKLNMKDATQILVSRTVGKSSSEMKLYFCIPEVSLSASNSSMDLISNVEGSVSLEPILNKRASYISGQNICGDAILANVGYTWRSSELFYEDVSLCKYYRMLLSKVPDGHYKLSREAILAAELPTAFTVRSNWKGPLPKDLLCVFCRQHRLSEPIFLVKNPHSSGAQSELSETCKESKLPRLSGEGETTSGHIGDEAVDKSNSFICEVKILSRRQDPLLEYSSNDIYRKESEAIQNAALKVLSWLNKYFKQLDMPIEKLSSFGLAHNITIYLPNFSLEFATLVFICGAKENYYLRSCSQGSVHINESDMKQENRMNLFNIQSADSGVVPSVGSLTCISYAVYLMRRGDPLKELLESKDEFEFEVGTGAVINELEACVTQLSVNQAAQFVTEVPSRDLILAAAGDCASSLSQLSLNNCFLEYYLKVLWVTEPLEDRMEQALFNPPLSKQRVEFAVRHINESRSTTLVDFGCGSGSLLDSLLEHTTSLQKIVGVDISQRSLTRAAKILHSKLSTNSVMQSSIKSAVLYDGSITDVDSRLCDFDIGTCLEVIEHMEEEQACVFGDVVLSSFCPRILIVSTPNYEYNPILQRSASNNKEDDSDEKSAACKFRNHDHKFEWTREQFERWATDVAARHNYIVGFSGVGGTGDAEPGFASQIAVFRSKSRETEKILSTNEEPSHPYEVIWEWDNPSRSSL